jgi:hypothetical protein
MAEPGDEDLLDDRHLVNPARSPDQPTR